MSALDLPGIPVAGWHISRSWSPEDPFVDSCGCEKAPCGGAVRGSSDGCLQHAANSSQTIRSAHRAEDCPKFMEGTRA